MPSDARAPKQPLRRQRSKTHALGGVGHVAALTSKRPRPLGKGRPSRLYMRTEYCLRSPSRTSVMRARKTSKCSDKYALICDARGASRQSERKHALPVYLPSPRDCPRVGGACCAGKPSESGDAGLSALLSPRGCTRFFVGVRTAAAGRRSAAADGRQGFPCGSKGA